MAGERMMHIKMDDQVSSKNQQSVWSIARKHPSIAMASNRSKAGALIWVVKQLDPATLSKIAADKQRTTMPLLVITCQAPDPDQSLMALSLGVEDILHGKSFRLLFNSIAARLSHDAEIQAIVGSPIVRDQLVGDSALWIRMLHELVAAARFSDSPILLFGETGTGKELLARLIHQLDSRSNKRDLVTVDCTTLTPDLAGSELFGHERGAFTGSIRARRGAIADAHDGTLFLDEIAELPLEVQAQLLRTLQENTFKAVGSNSWQKANFRLVCATHRDLGRAVETGKFRADLYFRIVASVIRVPPLRERTTDIRLLANSFLREYGCHAGIDDTVHLLLSRHDFPGNVRELRQLMRNAARGYSCQRALSIGCLPSSWRERLMSPAPVALASTEPTPTLNPEYVVSRWLEEGLSLQAIARRASDLAIKIALSLEQNHLGRAAQRLGVTARAIQLRRTRGALTNKGG